jgi:hypothetical protein
MKTRTILLILIGVLVLTHAIIFVATPFFFKSFIDLWPYKVYFETLVIPFLTQGQLPYIDYSWEYPILMLVPVIIAAAPAVITKDASLFFISFPILMVICSIVTMLCVYFITLKIYGNPRRAFIAAFLFATAFSVAYHTLFCFDPFPTSIVMIGITLTVYGGNRFKDAGYLSFILGFFTKIYPIVLLPFVVFYNSKPNGIKREAISVAKIGVIVGMVLFVPIFIMNPNSIGVYFTQNAANKPIFVDTLSYTVYNWIHVVARVPVSVDIISNVMYIIAAGMICALLYISYFYPSKSPVVLLKLSLCALFVIIAFSKYHSPQYMMWFIPILCILITGDIVKIVLFYAAQIIGFIKFPLIFGKLYTNNSYVSMFPQPDWQITLFFFTLEYALYFYLIWITTRPLDLYRAVVEYRSN